MKKIVELLQEELSAAFVKAGYDKKYAKVTVSNRPDLCQYQCNGALAAAKEYHKAPIQMANEVVDILKESEKEQTEMNETLYDLEQKRKAVEQDIQALYETLQKEILRPNKA